MELGNKNGLKIAHSGKLSIRKKKIFDKQRNDSKGLSKFQHKSIVPLQFWDTFNQLV